MGVTVARGTAMDSDDLANRVRAMDLHDLGLIHAQLVHGDPAVVDAMLTLRPELLHAPHPDRGAPPAVTAACAGRIEMLEVLLRHGMDPNDTAAPTRLSLLGLAQLSPAGAGAARWLVVHGARPSHLARHELLDDECLSWEQITVTDESRLIPDAAEFKRLRTRLRGDFPAGYLEFMSRFGRGEIGQPDIAAHDDMAHTTDFIARFRVYTPDRIIKQNTVLNRMFVIRLIGEAGHNLLLYPNVSDVFTERQIRNLMVAGGLDGDYLGFVQGETGWYSFPDEEGLIEYAGDDLQQALGFLIRFGMFSRTAGVLFKPYEASE